VTESFFVANAPSKLPSQRFRDSLSQDIFDDDDDDDTKTSPLYARYHYINITVDMQY